MMNKPMRTSLLLAAGCSAGLVGLVASSAAPGRLDASQALFADSDGDMLPDCLEWVLLLDPSLTDSDGDGLGDFVEAAQNKPPTAANPPMDHEMRLSISGVTLPDGSVQVLANVLIRIAGGGVSQIGSFNPYVEIGQVRYPISALIASNIVSFSSRNDPVEGELVLMTSRIASTSQLEMLMPMTFGFDGDIGGVVFHNGSVLNDTDDVTTSIVAYGPNRFALHPIQSPQGPLGSVPYVSFWSSSKVCEMDLVAVGSGGGSIIAQVVDAHCSGAATLLCAPSCSSMAGQIFVIPDGLSFLGGS